MPYTRRRTWPDSDREDYVIRCEGLDVGRVYRTRLPDGDRFVWTIYMNRHVPQVDGVPTAARPKRLTRLARNSSAAMNGCGRRPDCRSRSGEEHRVALGQCSPK
jgi:hypothetical protein